MWHGRPSRSGPDRLPPATLHGDDRGLLASNRRYPRVMVDTRNVRARRASVRCNHGSSRAVGHLHSGRRAERSGQARWVSRSSSPDREPSSPAWRCRGATTRAGRSSSAPKPRSASRSRTSSPTPRRRRSPAPAKPSSRCSSPRSSCGRRSRRSPSDAGRVRRATRSARSPRSSPPGVLPLDDGVRFAARRAELTQAAADAHPGRMAALLGATPEQADDACTAAPDGVLGRQRQRARPGRDRRHARRPRRRFGPRQGARRAAGHRRSTSAARSTRRSWPTPPPGSPPRSAGLALATPDRARRVEPRRRRPTPTPTAGATASPTTSRCPVRWRSTMDTLVGLGADTFLEVGPRLDARRARQARRPRRHRPQRRHPRRHPHDSTLEVG